MRVRVRDGSERRRVRWGSREDFGVLVEPYRLELLVHCYRMVGSFPRR